jgi:hypothetical protein
MRTRLLVAAAFVGLSGLSNVFAADPALIQESLTAGSDLTEYSVLNQSQMTATPFDISAFAVATTGTAPSNSDPNWTAQALNSASWSSMPMGGTNPNEPLTWQQYTGMTWNQAFPTGPVSGKVNGYFLSYLWNSGAMTVSFPDPPVYPSNPAKGGFFFQGMPMSDMFLVVGPTDASMAQPLSDFQTFEGQSMVVPEPSSLALSVIALGCGAMVVRRSRRS